MPTEKFRHKKYRHLSDGEYINIKKRQVAEAKKRYYYKNRPSIIDKMCAYNDEHQDQINANRYTRILNKLKDPQFQSIKRLCAEHNLHIKIKTYLRNEQIKSIDRLVGLMNNLNMKSEIGL